MGGAYSTVPEAITAAIPAAAETGEVLGGLQTAGERAFTHPDGRWWRVPVWWVVADRHAWLIAVHEDRSWFVGIGEPRDVALETAWRRDVIRVGPWRMPLRRGDRKAAQPLYAAWERARWGGPAFEAPDDRPAGRAAAARGARDLPPWWATEVPADPEERWLVAAETKATHPLSLPDGSIREETLWLGLSDRRVALGAHADGATWAHEVPSVSDVGRGARRFDGGLRRFGGGDDVAAVVALAAGDAEARWAAAATKALANREVRKGLDLIGEAHERGLDRDACDVLARILQGIGRTDRATHALAEHLRRRPETDVANGASRWATDARHLRVSAKAERIDDDAIRSRAGALLDAIPVTDPPPLLPWPPEGETETWLAALVRLGRWSDVEPILPRLPHDPRGETVRYAVALAREPDETHLLAAAAAIDAGAVQGAGPSRWDLWVRVAGLRGDGLDALHEAITGDFLRPEAYASVRASTVAVPPALSAWWGHLHRLFDPQADPGAPASPRETLDADALDALHPGGAGWLEEVRTKTTPPKPPARSTLVRGLDRLDAAPEAAHTLADVAGRLGLADPQAWLYRGEGAWGAAAWPLDPPLLLVGYDHLAAGPRHLDRAGLAFLLAVETTHLVCRHPLLAFDRDLLGTSRSVYTALGRWAGPAETAVDVLGLVPGIDQVAKIQTVIRLTKRLFQARGVVEKASTYATGVASWLRAPSESSPGPLGREGLTGAAMQFRTQADRAALLVTGDLRAAIDAILRSSSQSLALADRVRDEGLAAVLPALPPDEALRITMLVEFAARQRPDAPGAP